MSCCFVFQWLWILPAREQLRVCGAGGDEGPSSGVLFKRDHRAATDQWVRTPVFILDLFSLFPCASASPSVSGMNLIFSLPAILSFSLSVLSPFLSLCLSLHLSYRKIPGDQCEGGFQPDRKETDLRRMCTSNALYPNSLVSSAHSGRTLSTWLNSYWDILKINRRTSDLRHGQHWRCERVIS